VDEPRVPNAVVGGSDGADLPDGADAPNASDAADALAARAGDRHAYERIVDRHVSRLHERAFREAPDRFFAIDATVEAFVRTWRDLPSRRPPIDIAPALDASLTSALRDRADVPATDATDVRQIRYVVIRRVRDTPEGGRWQRRLARLRPRRSLGSAAAPRPVAAGGSTRSWVSLRTRRAATSRRRVGARSAVLVAASIAVLAAGAVGVGRLAGPSGPSVAASPSVPPSEVATPAPASPRPTPVATPTPADLVAFARDGDIYLIVGSAEAELVAHVEGLRFHGPILSPDGALVAFTSDEPAAFVLDLRTPSLRRLGHGFAEAFSPDAAALALSDPFRVIDLTTGIARPLSLPAGTTINRHRISWSPNGAWIVASADVAPDATHGPKTELLRIALNSGAVMPLTDWTDSGNGAPVWSPNSTEIAVNDDTNLVVMDGTGDNRRIVLNSTQFVGRPAWSPDGSSIAVRLLPSSRSTDGTVSIVPVDGGASRSLGYLVHGDVAWNAAGTGIVYVTTQEMGATDAWSGTVTDGDVLETIVDSGATERLTTADVDLDWLGEREPVTNVSIGQSAVVPALPRATGVWGTIRDAVPVADAVAGGTLRVAGKWRGLGVASGCVAVVSAFPKMALMPVLHEDGAQSCFIAGWAPDGSALAAAIDDVLTIHRSDRSANVVVSDTTPVASVSWSPRGTWLAVNACLQGIGPCDSSSFLIMTSGGGVVGSVPGYPVWSPDERRIAIEVDGTLLVGTDANDLVRVGADITQISWAPDGSRIAFLRDGDAWTMKADGTEARNVSRFEFGGATAVSWAPDGRTILVQQPAGSAWLYRPDGTVVARVSQPWAISQVDWAPDGSRVALTGRDFTGESYTYLVDRGGTTAILLADSVFVTWSPDARYLAISGGEQSGGHIDVAAADGSGRTKMVDMASDLPVTWFSSDTTWTTAP
jgi:Tol biopolymer transport system component